MLPKILLVDTSYPINSRNRKIADSIKAKFGDNSIRVVSWHRDDRFINENDKNDYIFELKSPYASPFRKLFNLIKFRRFLKDINERYDPYIIIASHWDTLVLLHTLKKDGQILIYENLDMPTGNSLTLKLIRKWESYALKNTNAISFASRFYLPYYDSYNGEKILLENKALKGFQIYKTIINTEPDILNLTFNGGLRYPDIMLNLINAVGSMPRIKLNIYGGSNMGDKVKILYEAAKKHDNIKFWGEYDYLQIPEIFAKSDLVWAVYPADDFNVKLAISNKYHESLFFGVPAIFEKNTKLGEFVEREGCGYTVNGYSVKDIRQLVFYIRDHKFSDLSEKSKKLSHIKNQESRNWEEEVIPFLEYIEKEFNKFRNRKSLPNKL